MQLKLKSCRNYCCIQ